MSRNKLFSLVLILISLFYFKFLVDAVRAGTTDTIAATVTAQNITVSVDRASVGFGVIGVGTTMATNSSGVNETSTAHNDGNTTEKFNIMAGNSTNWTLNSIAAGSTYAMQFCVAADCDASPTWSMVGIDPAYATLNASIGAGLTQPFDLLMMAPTSTSNYDQQSITVTIQATTP